MREPDEGRDRRVAGGDVIADLAENLHRVGVALRRQRLGERRAADAAAGVDVVPGVADADGAAQPLAAAIGGVRGEIFAVDLGAVVTTVEAEIRAADPRRERRGEAVAAEADARDQPLVIGIHREVAAIGVEIAPADKGRAPDERPALDRKSTRLNSSHSFASIMT